MRMRTSLHGFLVLAFSASLVLSIIDSGVSWGGNAGVSARISALERQGARVGIHPRTGLVSFIGSPAVTARTPAAAGRCNVDDTAMAFIKNFGQLLGLRDPERELRKMKRADLSDGRSMVHYQQMHQGVPVIAGEIIVNMDRGCNLLSLGGEVSPSPALSTEPKLTASEARDIAVDAVAKWYTLPPADLDAAHPGLWIYDPQLVGPGAMPPSLVWRTEVGAKAVPVREFALVDAQTGRISLHFTLIKTAKDRLTYDANSSSVLPGTLLCTESSDNDACTASALPDADYAHRYAGDAYDFYANYHGRDGIDGLGMTIVSSVRYCAPGWPCPFRNAYWNGSQMVYGEGYSGADDVAGHELTHGVTEYESNLLYYYQSGAISESLSDLWGEFIDQTNGSGTDGEEVRWKIGEDLPAPGAVRDMRDPTLFDDPDRMTSSYYDPDDDFLDNGGVHANSGVNNKAVYLMTDGGTFNGRTVTGLGISSVARIYYETQTNLLTSGSNYYDLYQYVYQACLNLAGTGGITLSDCEQVRNAADAVEMNLEPTAGFEPIASLCSDGQVSTDLFFDDMEDSTNWIFSNLLETNWWYFISGYATSGTQSLYVDDIALVSDSVAAMASDVLLPANSFLHFKHSFGFEAAADIPLYFDGGVLEYSIDAGVTWHDAGVLYAEGRNYGGTLSSDFSNPLGGRSAFVGNSHGYVSSRYDLSSLAGQYVRFRFREANDSTVPGLLGWVVDDVRIYTCATTFCTYAITPASTAYGSSGGAGSVIVSAGSGCEWTSASNDAWITVTSGASGTGSGMVNYSVAVNAGPARIGTLTIAGRIFTVTQEAAACTYAINPASAAYDFPGGTGSVDVAAGSWCDWTAASNDTWITVTSGAGGTGSGTVAYSVANNSGAGRTGTITIADQTFTVTQGAAVCTYTITPISAAYDSSGGTGSVSVEAESWCTWTATRNDAWITITSDASGTGIGTVTYSVADNAGASRAGTITIADQTFTVNQSAASCTFTITPTNAAYDALGGTGSVSVTADTWCDWTAVTNDTWITITGGASGIGNGTVTYSVATNAGMSRTGTITIAGQAFTINQGATACTYAITPTSASYDSSGGTGSVSVTAGNWCDWTATSNDVWITVTAGASRTGSGMVNYSVANNSGASRTGTITIAGQTFTVAQSAAACTYTITPTSADYDSTGGSGSVSITAGIGCSWTSVSNDTWITVTAGASGTGSGIVTYSVTENTGPVRTGTIIIAGQTFTVAQNAAACTYTITPTNASYGSTGGTGSIGVTAGNWCTWTTVSHDAWITVTAGASGTGSGTVTYSIASNPGAARTGMITVAGQTFTVTQSSPPDGDLDGNGVSATDALRALRIAAALVTATGTDMTHGDVAPLLSGIPRPNGEINISDAAVILRRAVGLISW